MAPARSSVGDVAADLARAYREARPLIIATATSVGWYSYTRAPEVVGRALGAQTPEEQRAAEIEASALSAGLYVSGAVLAGVGTEWVVDDGLPMIERLFSQTLEDVGGLAGLVGLLG